MSGGLEDPQDDEADDDRSPVPGVREIDHTADVALEVEAPDVATLFERAARGTVWLLFGRIPGDVEGGDARAVELAAHDLPSLLRTWLGDVVFWQETEGWVASGLEIDAPLDSDGRSDHPGGGSGEGAGEIHLRGTARGGTTGHDPVREIKGVTRHGLTVERRRDGWFARVIFDV